MNIIKNLDWDSRFFKKKITLISLCNGDISFLKEQLEKCEKRGCELE